MHQCFERIDFSGNCRYNWLIVIPKFLSSDQLPELFSLLFLTGIPVINIRIKLLNIAFRRTLNLIHCKICILRKFFSICCIIWIPCHSC